MKRIILVLAFVLLFLCPNHVFAKPSSTTVQKPQLKQAFGQIPLSFESNQGQVDGSVRFLYRGYTTREDGSSNLESGPTNRGRS